MPAEMYQFSLLTLCVLLGLSLVLCASNFVFLRRNALTKRQLEASRSFQLFIQRKGSRRLTQVPYVSAGKEFLTKSMAVGVCYWLVSHGSDWMRVMGLVVALVVLSVQVRLVLRELFDPKGLIRRKQMLFRYDSRFIRQRLCFELVRRVLAITLFVGFVSFAMGSLWPSVVKISESADAESALLLHVQSAVAGMTSLSRDSVVFHGGIGAGFEVVRGLFGFAVLIGLVSILVNGIGQDDPVPIESRHKGSKNEAVADKPVAKPTKDEIRAKVRLVVEQELCLGSMDLDDDACLIQECNADSIDFISIIMGVEDSLGFEIPNERANTLETVNDIVECVNYCFEPRRD